MDKSLVLYENINFKNLFKSKKFLTFKGESFDIYKGSIVNPPFFKNLFYENPKNFKDIYIAWNSTLLNGYLIIPEKFSKFLKNKEFKNIQLLKKTFCIYHKLDNEFFIINDKFRVFDFLIIGVEKGGTTSLLTNLSKHSDIDLANPDHHLGGELHYFDYHISKGRDLKWLKSHFNYKKKIVGYKNPNLIYLDYTHQYISNINPFVKMILVLRNPIDRAYSEWYMMNSFTDYPVENPKTFKEAIEEELNYRISESPNFFVANSHHLQKGLYYKQIKKLLKIFPMQNLCIILNEDLKNKEKETYEKMYNFLNVKIKHSNYEVRFEGKYSKNQKEKDITPSLKKKIVNFLKSDVKKLEKLLNIKTNWF